jgi:hypothetical protein
MQQIENRKLQEHVNLLETDLDSIQNVIYKVQKKLTLANDQIAEKDSKINSLEEMLGATKIDKLAFETFSNQNKLLLNKYLEEQKESSSSYEELQRIKQEMKAMTEAIETKSKQMIQNEITLSAEMRQLKDQLQSEVTRRSSLETQVEMLTSQLHTTQQLFEQHVDLKSDEVRRFKNVEYQNLLKSDLERIEFHKLQDDYEILQDTLHLTSEQTEKLNLRLKNVTIEKNENNSLLYHFIQQTEEKNYETRIRDKKLLKENESLQQEVIHLKRTLKEICERNEKIEQEYEKEKLRRVMERKYENQSGINTSRGTRSQKNTSRKADEIDWGLITSRGLIQDLGSKELVTTSSSSLEILPNIIRSSEKPKQRGTSAGKKHPAGNRRGAGHQVLNKISSRFISSEIDDHHDHRVHSVEVRRHQPVITGLELESSFYESSTSQILDKYDHDRSYVTHSGSLSEGGEPKEQPTSTGQLGFSAVDTIQYQGKRCLLAKYLRHLVTVMNTISAPPSLKMSSFDLSRSSLTDMDMIQAIDWFRLISVQEITSIDFRYNLLTAQGMSYLATWILSLDHKDLIQRKEPLHLFCQYNLVSLLDLSSPLTLLHLQVDTVTIPNLLAQLYQTPHPDIKYIETDENGLVLVLYGNRDNPNCSQQRGKLILKWNFQNNCEDPIMASPKKTHRKVVID